MTPDPAYRIDLASARLGGRAIAASDEFFAGKDNLLKPERPVFLPDRYTDHGKWMDGWETRRRRDGGYDWCVVRLGAPGQMQAVVVDTAHFKGNHPASCSLEGAVLDGAEPDDDTVWTEVLGEVELAGDTEHHFAVTDPGRYTHVRFNIYPDGGVARLRVYGDPLPDWSAVEPNHAPVDLASAVLGGRPVECSDEFFSEPLNLLVPGNSRGMADGWETRRRRGPGHDWVIIALAARGTIETIEVDTTHFKGNFPEGCCVEVRDGDAGAWVEVLPQTSLRADARHRFREELLPAGPVTHVRLNIYPDGGVARLRVYGRPVA